jgi:hypothetical protein
MQNPKAMRQEVTPDIVQGLRISATEIQILGHLTRRNRITWRTPSGQISAPASIDGIYVDEEGMRWAIVTSEGRSLAVSEQVILTIEPPEGGQYGAE